jgi:hypothetical protein
MESLHEHWEFVYHWSIFDPVHYTNDRFFLYDCNVQSNQVNAYVRLSISHIIHTSIHDRYCCWLSLVACLLKGL